MSEHVIVVLPNPDWIQLANVHRKILNHGGSKVYTTTTVASANLSSLIPKVRKIHVVGHGSSTSLSGVATNVFAKALKDGGMPDGVQIRLDTCSSGEILNSGSNITALLLLELRNQHGYKNLIAQGTTGASITGWAQKRGVVIGNMKEYVVIIQKTLMIAHKGSIDQANIVIQGWTETKSSDEIKLLALGVFNHVEQFFKDFYTAITDVSNYYNVDILYDRNKVQKNDYKTGYQI
jgi:hypothetical protein